MSHEEARQRAIEVLTEFREQQCLYFYPENGYLANQDQQFEWLCDDWRDNPPDWSRWWAKKNAERNRAYREG